MKLNAVCALLCAAALSFLMACLQSLYASVLAAVLGASLFFFASPPAPVVFKRLLVANFFIFFTWLIVPFTAPGPTFYNYGWFHVSENGLRLCVLVTLKANAIVCVFLALIAPLSITRVCGALKKLRVPDKLIWLFLLMDENVRVFLDRLKALREGTKLRGFKARFNLRSYKVIASLVAILLINAADRAEKIHEATLLRAYSGKLPLLDRESFGVRDLALLTITVAYCALFACVELKARHAL